MTYIYLYSNYIVPHRWCLHLIVVVEFECSLDPESYAGGSVATGRGTHVGQVKGLEPYKEEQPGPPGWGLGVRINSHHKTKLFRNQIISLGWM
jgi:hypothetical protein